VGVGQITELTWPEWEESDITFDHLGAAGSKLKSDSQKVNSSLPCGQKGLVTAHKPASSGTTSENLPALDGPSHQGKPRFKHPDLIPPKAV
jgi:hypothetical protein